MSPVTNAYISLADGKPINLALNRLRRQLVEAGVPARWSLERRGLPVNRAAKRRLKDARAARRRSKLATRRAHRLELQADRKPHSATPASRDRVVA